MNLTTIRRAALRVSGVLMLSLATTVPALAQTLKLTESNATTIRGGTYANTNFSKDVLLATRASDDATFVRRVLLKFDTQNTIPAKSLITSAKLTLTVSGGNSQTRQLAAYRVAMSYEEVQSTWKIRKTGYTWSRAGGDLAEKAAVATVTNSAGSHVSFDVTDLVQGAVNGSYGSSRYTRIAVLDTGGSDRDSYKEYFSDEAGDVSVRPLLTVTVGAGTASAPPPPSTSTTSGSTLKVLEYNVHHGGYGTDGKYDVNRIINVILKVNPDIISLCEMEANDGWVSVDGVALYETLLEQKTGVKWYSLAIQDYGDWSSSGIRNAILSKHPFSSTYRHEFSTGKDRTVGGVLINVNGRNINFMSTHFDPDSGSNRATQAKELVSYAGGFAEDRIMLGDFNDQPTSTPMLTIIGKYHDAWADAKSAGIAYSTSDNPNGYTRNSRIDYVFYSRGEAHLTLKKVEVVETRDASGVMPSDHRPLVATFTVQ
jgi:endonuclease/exonuclease/phosphatase family metal-dependent hydrolase